MLTAKTPQDSASPQEAVPAELWAAFFEGSRQACARMITRIENDPDLVPEMRHRLAAHAGKAVRIGITGPPGVGKSTLTAAIAGLMAEQGHRVGVVAVDPSSPFTGGAFMGDRIRMEALTGDKRVFIRSMASREGHGGLSPMTPYVADVLEGFGMDRILIETVGVGQAELDVLSCSDLVLLVLQPGTGDQIQTLKAGIIEGADLIVVNKSDQPGVDTVLQSLRFLFSLSGPRPDLRSVKGAKHSEQGPAKPAPPVLSTSAQKNEGLEELVAEIEKQSSNLASSGVLHDMRRRRLEDEIRAAIQKHLWRTYDALTGAEHELRRKAEELVESGESPYNYVEQVCSDIDIDIRKADDGSEDPRT